MFETLDELWEIVVDIWDTGNQWVKWALICILCWPLIPLAYGLWGSNVLVVNALVGLIPAIGFLIIFIARFVDPLVLAVLANVKKGRQVVQLLFTIVAGESAIGLYFTLVPVANNRPMIPVFVLTAITLIFFMLGVQGKWVAKVRVLLLLMMLGITGSFFTDWISKVQELLTQPKELGEIPVLFREDGHIEDGLYINPQNKYVAKYAKKENVISQNGNIVEVLYNCDKNIKITDVEPDQSIEVSHIIKRLEMDNRCSYSYAGDYYPIYGAVGQVARPKYRNDMPYPDKFPAQSVVFQLRDSNGTVLAENYINGIGKSIYLMNTSNEVAEVWVIYNYMSSFQGEQVGYDGSSTTFKLKIM